jgi:protein TonB
MEAMMNWSIYEMRERVAQFGTLAIGLLFAAFSQLFAVQHLAPKPEEPISLSIVAPEVEEQAVVEQVIQMPPPPVPVVDPPPAEVVPVVDAPAPPIQEVVPPPVPVVEPPVQVKANPDAEYMFAQDVRSRIERKKIYPDAARDLGMSGAVEVQYELDRAGNLLRAEIVSSSGFKMLDKAALMAVKSATYKSFPEDAWLGSGSKVFRTKLVFSINQ